MNIAILVDGAFYRKRAKYLSGTKTSVERAIELQKYCEALIRFSRKKDSENAQLYRIYYYDCKPAVGNVWHPLKQKNIALEKTDISKWTIEFFNELKKRRKFALRLGVLSQAKEYILKPDVIKELLKGKKSLDELAETDFKLNVEQKGVDMRIGIDIASLAYKKQVQQIILISGDSDFVPAAKLARKEGIDFILDPMGMGITGELQEHIDGLRSVVREVLAPKKKTQQEVKID